MSTDAAHNCRQLLQRWRELNLVTFQNDLDLEERVGARLSVAVDGPGELLEGPLDVEAECLLHHAVHLLCVSMPMLLNLGVGRETTSQCSRWELMMAGTEGVSVLVGTPHDHSLFSSIHVLLATIA